MDNTAEEWTAFNCSDWPYLINTINHNLIAINKEMTDGKPK